MFRHFVTLPREDMDNSIINEVKTVLEFSGIEFQTHVAIFDKMGLKCTGMIPLYHHDLFRNNFENFIRHSTTIRSDIATVDFDLENIFANEKFDPTVGYRELPNGFKHYVVMAGGDWEIPVYFVVYWDGNNVRAYVPERGNTFNHETRTAYGSEEHCKTWFGTDEYDVHLASKNDPFDVELFNADIMANILEKV